MYYWRTYLLHKSKMRRISTEFDIWTVSSSLETSLGDLEWRAFVPQGLLQGLDVLLLVVDLLHGLAQVGLQLVVSVVGLRDPLLERHVRVVPVAPHLVRGLQHQCQSVNHGEVWSKLATCVIRLSTSEIIRAVADLLRINRRFYIS